MYEDERYTNKKTCRCYIICIQKNGWETKNIIVEDVSKKMALQHFYENYQNVQDDDSFNISVKQAHSIISDGFEKYYNHTF